MRQTIRLAGMFVALAGLALVAAAAPSQSPAERLPECPVVEPGTAAGYAPVGSMPSLDDPAACRAEPTRVEPADPGQLPVPRPGYHHLGVTTAGNWSGITGRLTVRETGVRPGRYDFVAARFLAKQASDGRLAWLEAGWADTGWSGDGAPRVYAFDSEAMAWSFFDQYRLADGDRISLYLNHDGAGWQAWLWWGGIWRLLAAPRLPFGEACESNQSLCGDACEPNRSRCGPGAQLEQYVEVHQDGTGPAGPAGPVAVPPVRIDRVRVVAAPGGPSRSWRPDRVPTVLPDPAGGYCLVWEQRYEAWSAGAWSAGQVPCKGGT